MCDQRAEEVLIGVKVRRSTGKAKHFLGSLAVRLSLAFSVILLFVACGGQVGGARNANSTAKDITAVQHIVFIVNENHTFDNYFGTFPGADGATSGATSTGQVVPLAQMPDTFRGILCN